MTVRRTKTYRDMRRALKDAVLREMNRYLLPYLSDSNYPNVIDYSTFRSYWDTYTRPLIFDVLTTPMSDLGIRSEGPYDQLTCSLDERNCFWSAEFYENTEAGKSDFLDLNSLTIPYSGPYQDLGGATQTRQNFLSSSWIEEDDVGTWVDPWIDPDGTYHPGYWTGYYDVSASGIVANLGSSCHLDNLICKPCRVYRVDTPGTYRNFYHEFEYYNAANYKNESYDPSSPAMLIYALYHRLTDGLGIYYNQQIGLWSVTSSREPGYRLRCSRNEVDPYGPGSFFGYGRKHIVEEPSLNDWFYLDDLNPKELRITVERRDDWAVFIFWYKRFSVVDVGDDIFDGRIVSLPWQVVGDGTSFDQNWPGLYNTSFQSLGSTVGFYNVRNDLRDTPVDQRYYWYPIDVIELKLNTSFNYNYVYVGNYLGRNFSPLSNTYTKPYGYMIQNLDFYEYSASNTSTLFVDGGTYKNDNMTLYNVAVATINDNVPLHLSVGSPMNLVSTLYVKGGTYEESNNDMPLFMYEREYVNDNFTLYISQREDDGYIPLHIIGEERPMEEDRTCFVYDLSVLQDFSNYTIEDTASQAGDAWTYTRIDARNLNNGGAFRWYYDFGSNFFSYLWSINFEFEWGGDGNVDFVPISVSNSFTALRPFGSSSEQALAFYYDQSAGQWYLEQFDEGNQASVTSPTAGKHYWCTLAREGTASGYQYSLSLWDNSARTGTPEITQTLDVTETYYYGKLTLGWVENAGGSDTISFVLEDVYFSDFPQIAGMDLFVDGKNVDAGIGTLYIIGWAETQNTYASLHIFGGTSGWSWKTDNMPLYINDGGYIGTDGEYNATLYLHQTDTHVDVDKSATLYMSGKYWTQSGSIDLVCFGLMADNEMSLFIKSGDRSGRDGYIPDDDVIPIFLNRPDESDSMSLVLYNEWLSLNTYTSLFTTGVLGIPNDGIDLVIPNVVEARPNTYTTMFTQSGITEPDSITLVMPETLEVVTDNATLFCCHIGGTPNTYTSCYIVGVEGIPTDNITLVIPDVVGKENDPLTFITKGY